MAACTCAASLRNRSRYRALCHSSSRCCRAPRLCAPHVWSFTMSEPIAVRVPQMNANVEQAIVVRWHVEKGARVRAGRTLVTLETTKATFDADAPEDGYAFFEHDANTDVDVGSAVAWISPSAELRLRPAPAPV